jgi:hypothetical protein
VGLTRAAILIVAFVAAISAAVELATRYRQGSGWRALETQMRRDLHEGSLQGLLRARIAAARVLAAEPDNAPIVAQLGFISAWLAHRYGLRSGREAEQALARLGGLSGHEQRDLDMIGALLALDKGQRERALQLAVATARLDPATLAEEGASDAPTDLRPLLLLARARALAGDPMGASKAAEAAIVREPHANAPLLAFAEARLDLHHLAPAEKAVRDVLARVPDHGPAILLLHRIQQATPGAPADPAAFEALVDACRRDGAVSPVVGAACDLAFATAARAAGKRGPAQEHALAAAGRKIGEPRVLARTALVLAQLGRIDEADGLASLAARTASADLPPLAWARAAITLGRGELALLPPGLPPACPETRLVAARAALIAGGPSALGAILADLGPAAPSADADLRALSALTTSATAGNRPRPGAAGAGTASAGGTTSAGGTSAAAGIPSAAAGIPSAAAGIPPSAGNPPAPAGIPPAAAGNALVGKTPFAAASPALGSPSSEGPVAAYAHGLRARLAGDAPTAVRWLSAALDGHGDACRAAGEYLAAARLANHPVTTELDRIRAVNTRCPHLAVPPPAAPARKPRPPRPARPAAARPIEAPPGEATPAPAPALPAEAPPP